jgi:YHS domain-containing protein
MRLLILCLLAYLGYRAVKALVFPGASSSRIDRQGSRAPIDDVMVKDPMCETYFPQRKGIKAVVKGETLYFCSKECRDKYIEGAEESQG